MAKPMVERRNRETREWLHKAIAPYVFAALQDEPEAVAILERELDTLKANDTLILADRPKVLILATRNQPGSLYRSLTARVGDRAISYAMFAHSTEPIPGMAETLELQRLEFDCRPDGEMAAALRQGVQVPAEVREAVAAAMRKDYRDFDMAELDALLAIIWANNASYARVAPPRRVAQAARLLQLTRRSGGLYLDVEPMQDGSNETRVSFGVATPPHRRYLAQMMEVLNRLDLGVARAYVLEVSTGDQPYALNAFYVRPRRGGQLLTGSPLHTQLERELFNTEILAASAPEYRELVTTGLMSGEDASLVRAFVAFAHTNLGHAQPDKFDWEEVRNAFQANPRMVSQLVKLFRTRFDPGLQNRERVYARELAEAERAVRDYNTGHKHLDDIRRGVFRCTLAFIRHTLKTNFFVKEKQAFSFRLDPAYLADLGPAFTSDLPQATPFRITFFYTRYGFGFHVGFSDIARGGWRTVICRTDDDFLTNASTLFRENFVLAHTQHFKNKDIYEGGSKLVLLMDASQLEKEERNQETLRLHKLQRGIIGAFLDIYVTRDGVASHPAVVDYYREDEPIELGPDENMHDDMIEEIAAISRARGYILGIGVMSSKRVGINHKEYAVTSTGVVKFAEITMKELGVDMRRRPFSVKLTGGPNGDVAGNAMAILLRRFPKVQLKLILDGTAALFDPEGASHDALRAILLQKDLDAFDPRALHPGGFMLFRTGSRKDGLRELFRKVTRGGKRLQEEWISLDEFSREFGSLPFTVEADLFIPGGGRPETIDKDNWQRFLREDGTPSARAIIEGANSFITPAARVELQKKGVLVMRDASANKCGVISSSYEIIANLLLSEEEFLGNKKRYVAGVLAILEKRAADEAHLILRRRQETGRLMTEISDAVSTEINANYARLFRFFQSRPELCLQEPFRRAILSHLPALLQGARFRKRINRLPPKYRSAILAAEIGSSMVYRGDHEAEFEDTVRLHLQRHFA
ncbi:MAG: NAD-glutamate dehydrogenase [Deltaproteobacteria bacterium]|nr:NAD-glutamate dehydrogenase [Deltaproteobacteria bacterium]